MRRLVFMFVAVVHLLLLDAATKEWAVRCLRGSGPFPVIGGFLDFAYVENRGCAWGMFQGHVWPLAMFAICALALLAWYRREIFMLDAKDWRAKAGAAAECLIYAGTVGNLIDRVFRGHVVDFIDFHLGDGWHFPCFNVADICISVAAGLLVVAAIFAPKTAPSEVSGKGAS